MMITNDWTAFGSLKRGTQPLAGVNNQSQSGTQPLAGEVRNQSQSGTQPLAGEVRNQSQSGTQPLAGEVRNQSQSGTQPLAGEVRNQSQSGTQPLAGEVRNQSQPPKPKSSSGTEVSQPEPATQQFSQVIIGTVPDGEKPESRFSKSSETKDNDPTLLDGNKKRQSKEEKAKRKKENQKKLSWINLGRSILGKDKYKNVHGSDESLSDTSSDFSTREAGDNDDLENPSKSPSNQLDNTDIASKMQSGNIIEDPPKQVQASAAYAKPETTHMTNSVDPDEAFSVTPSPDRIEEESSLASPSHSPAQNNSSSLEPIVFMLSQLFTLTEAVKANNYLMSSVFENRNQRDIAEGRQPIGVPPRTDPKEEVTYQNMQRVKVKIVFARITDIDTIGQHFDAEVYIQARWTESRFMGMTEEELNEMPFEECWNPKLKILNLYSGLDKDRLSIMIRYEDYQIDPVVTYMWHVKAVFLEQLELEHFPFDVQELSVVLSSDRPLDEIDLIPDIHNVSNVSCNAVQDNQEWKSFRHVEFAQDFRSTDFFSSSIHPVLVASCHVNRRLGFYMWNIFIIVFFILGLSLTVLAIDPTGTDRLQVTMTLFLTCVAFKIVVKTTLPNISYLTYLDVYVVFTMMYLVTQAAENAIISHVARFRDREKVLVYDEIAQSIIIALLVLFHAIFLIYIQVTAFNRRRLMGDKEHAFHLNLASKSKRAYVNTAARTDLSKKMSKRESI